MVRRCGLLVVLLSLAAHDVAAQDVRLTAQLRPRFEHRDPDFPAPPLGDVTMRARAGLVASLPEDLALRIDLQDVIIWGGTAATPGASLSAEVHQAFLDVGLFERALTLRAGRQEFVVDNQRLISNNNWGQRGRRFDGVRAIWQRDALTGGLFAMRIVESGMDTTMNAWFHGGHATLGLRARDSLTVYALYSRERGPATTDQLTTGGRAVVGVGGLALLAEAFAQLGTRRDEDIAAWLFSLGIRHAFDPVTATLAWDRYSGDDEPGDGKVRTFNRLFASNHSFHGYADIFVGAELNTGGRGLDDFMLRTQSGLGQRTKLEVNAHAFRVPADDGLTTARLGEELDAVLRHALRPGLALEGGVSFFRTGDATTEILGLGRNLTFGYLMATVQL